MEKFNQEELLRRIADRNNWRRIGTDPDTFQPLYAVVHKPSSVEGFVDRDEPDLASYGIVVD